MKRIVIIVAIVAILVALAYSGRTMDSEEVIDSKPDSANNGGSLTLTSPAFKHMERIPSRYTCDGENLSPPLNISGVPEGVESLVLLMDDPDIPDYVKKERGIEVFDHWVLYGIDPETVEIGEGQAIGSQGLNSSGNVGYRGSCPPDGEHRYFFKLYALNGALNFIKAPTKAEVLSAIQGMIISETELIGLYERN